MSTVFIERAGDYGAVYESTLRLLERAKLADIVPRRGILIKPNLVTDNSSREGITTDVAIVDALVRFLKERGCGDVFVGEGCGAGATGAAFRRNGYLEMAKKHCIPLLDFDESEGVEVEVPGYSSARKLKVARAAYEARFRISVAKLKVHSIGVVTGCLKNMMGCLSGKQWKLVVHSDVQRRVVDLNRLVMPHFGIVDGVVGNEVEECDPNPVPMGVLIGGRDAVSVDSISAECMGVRWSDVPYLVLAEKAGLGTADAKNIQVVGEDVASVRRDFRRSSGLWTYVRTRGEMLAGRVFENIKR